MSISEKDLRILFQKSGNRCAFPECGELLTLVDKESDQETEISVSDVAHIVARNPEGPRGGDSLPVDQRDRLDNLILLCKKHHRLVDEQPASYPVEKLRAFKTRHEALVQEGIARVLARSQKETAKTLIEERLFSTLLPVERMPRNVFSAPVQANSEKEVTEKLSPLTTRR